MYWLASLPLLDDSEERAWTLVQNRTTYESNLSNNYRFTLPELRVGTLDSLMVLSDELVKVNGLVESVVNKVRRQLFEMGAINGGDTHEARPLALVLLAPLILPHWPHFRYTSLAALRCAWSERAHCAVLEAER
jgi:hypothetical protein